MSAEIPRHKFVASVTFRGFEATPEEVQSLIGKAASLLVQRGNARIPGGTPFSRSAASWKLSFPDVTRLDEMIPALIDYLGGVQNLAAAKKTISPEFLEFDISMWILDSEEQEGGAIDASTIGPLLQLGATMSFGFYRRGDA